MSTATMLLALLGSAVVSSLIPAVNAEALVLASALAAPPELAFLIALVVTVGQVAGKVVLYGGGLGAARRARGSRGRRALEMADRLRDRPLALRWTFFAAAFVGLPPLYVMSVVAGLARLPLMTFLVLCLIGRFLRFYGLVLLPGAIS